VLLSSVLHSSLLLSSFLKLYREASAWKVQAPCRHFPSTHIRRGRVEHLDSIARLSPGSPGSEPVKGGRARLYPPFVKAACPTPCQHPATLPAPCQLLTELGGLSHWDVVAQFAAFNLQLLLPHHAPLILFRISLCTAQPLPSPKQLFSLLLIS
jgi:hypothetical protein